MTTWKLAGLDLGGTNVRCGAVHMESNAYVCSNARLRPLGTRDFDQVTHILIEEIQRIAPIDAIGIAVAGMIDIHHRHVVRAPNLDWTHVPLAQKIKDACGVPVFVLNDVNAITWGEYMVLNPPHPQHMLAIFFGTGVGGGWVANGHLVEGARGQALEIGHVEVDASPNAPLCGCGRRGCLEAFVGGYNFQRWIQGKMPFPIEHMGRLDEMAQTGNPMATDLLEQLATMTARVLSNALILLDPGVLMVGGTVWDGCPTFASRVRTLIHHRVPEAVQWVAPQLGMQAGILGAAAFAGAQLSEQE